MDEVLFEPLGNGRYQGTELTQGPWDPTHQHGGAPSALLAHALEQTAPRDGMTITQVSIDILGPVPIGELTVSTEVSRDGKRVQCLSAELVAEGRAAMRAKAWRMRRAVTPAGVSPHPEAPIPLAAATTTVPPPAGGLDFAYWRALDWRLGRGELTHPGPVTIWTRLRVPVVAGCTPSPLQRTLAAADYGSGVSAELSFCDYLFTNVDLTLHLYRQPEGEWVCLDSATNVGQSGSGLCRTELFDEKGGIGAAAQALFVAPRG